MWGGDFDGGGRLEALVGEEKRGSTLDGFKNERSSREETK